MHVHVPGIIPTKIVYSFSGTSYHIKWLRPNDNALINFIAILKIKIFYNKLKILL